MTPNEAVKLLKSRGWSVYRIAIGAECTGTSVANIFRGGSPSWDLGQRLIALAKREARKAPERR